MTKAIVITADKQVSEREVNGLDEMQAIVGGLIQPVDLVFGCMYVNEEGIYLCPDFNSIATDVAGLGGRTDLLLQGLTGDVFIVGPVDDEGDHGDVTEAARRAVQRVAREAGGTISLKGGE